MRRGLSPPGRGANPAERAAGRAWFLGSENFSLSSLRKNRELGIRTTDHQVVAAVATVLGDDYAGATQFS